MLQYTVMSEFSCFLNTHACRISFVLSCKVYPVFHSQLTQIHVQYSRHDCACSGCHGNTISALPDGNGLLVSQEYKQGHRLQYCSRKLLTNNSIVLKFNIKAIDSLNKKKLTFDRTISLAFEYFTTPS